MIKETAKWKRFRQQIHRIQDKIRCIERTTDLQVYEDTRSIADFKFVVWFPHRRNLGPATGHTTQPSRVDSVFHRTLHYLMPVVSRFGMMINVCNGSQPGHESRTQGKHKREGRRK